MLLNHGADINAMEDKLKSTPLGWAARFGQKKLAEFLLDRGADPNLAGALWATPLAWAENEVTRKSLKSCENTVQQGNTLQ